LSFIQRNICSTDRQAIQDDENPFIPRAHACAALEQRRADTSGGESESAAESGYGGGADAEGMWLSWDCEEVDGCTDGRI